MARERPFTDELKDYRGIGKRRSVVREHLQRWADDFRAQEIWDKFKEHNPTASPQELILTVLKARDEGRWIARLSQATEEPEEWRKYYARRAAEIFARQKPLWETAGEVGALFYAMLEAAEVFELHRGYMLDGMPPHIGRQKKTRKRDNTQPDTMQRDDNWAARRLCIIAIDNFWQRQCSRPDDAAVAALTEIAIPGTEITPEQVRNVRRSIKRGRVIKPA
jgi:hypothetical protein